MIAYCGFTDGKISVNWALKILGHVNPVIKLLFQLCSYIIKVLAIFIRKH
jgi:hypothetical protein